MPKPLTDSMMVRPEILGAEGLLMPMLGNISSQRGMMFAAHLPQTVVLNNATVPKIATGAECLVGKYSFEGYEFPEETCIQTVVPKYKNVVLTGGVNPSVTVIYTTAESKSIGYFQMDRFTQGSGQFGYENVWEGHHLRRPGARIPAGTKYPFSHAPNQDGDMFKFGIDMNVMYCTEWGTTEDATIISDEKCRELEHTAVCNRSIVLEEDNVPLNLYGDDQTYRIFPDITQRVRKDGILFAMRDVSDNSMVMADFTDDAMVPQIHDNTFVVKAGASVVDVTVHLGNQFDQIASKHNPEIYRQLLQYNDQQTEYYKTIVETYFTLVEEGYTADKQFSTLVEYALSMLCMEMSRSKVSFKQPARRHMMDLMKSRKSKRLALVDNKEYIPFAKIIIHLTYPVVPTKGFKITGRDGAKCVVSDVWPKERMPVDDYGNRADILIAGKGAFNRMNTGQFNEQFLTRVANDLHMQICSMDDTTGYALYLDFLQEIWPEYAEMVKTMSKGRRDELMDDIKMNGIQLVIYPTLRVDFEELVHRLRDKYQIKKTPVTYQQKNADGTIETIRTKADFFIGSKYIMLLDKNPEYSISGVNLSYVSQFQLPVHPSTEVKHMDVLKQTPIRLGEDEIAMLVMSVGTEEATRIVGLLADCPAAIEQLSSHLLTDEYPTRLGRIEMSTKEIAEKSNRIRLLNHLLGCIGIEMHAEL